ncbi:hypothetical protein NADFUDRAFT_23691 [Nadsonia fulvescens var. elongata DSM 6958]|uniref:3-isopropylmalate dehydratase n=1 Tax=Nadsonia fulvescens var. elongata DSM 6958 TaxID=857566 RepID=A0A1E3PMT5_9ASCO|nr:hypothetical protein NADFUDRAFT_23691 [Nadsonia fulvescens var. elongata DSM 6958]
MPSTTIQPQTLYDKVFQDHVVHQDEHSALLFVDRHLVHEVTSPQAFEGLKNAGRKVRRTDCTLATVDHNTPTTKRTNFTDIASFVKADQARLQCTTLEQNVKDFGVRYFGLNDARQGIVHVVGPEQGFTLPGTTVVCGDSHTSTHGAFGALAFGIGTSEVEHVLATQTIIQYKSKNMLIHVNGKLSPGITSKDLVLHIIGIIGTAGGTGCVLEFAGDVISDLSMESRMSICNMAIEAGARAGMIAPDQITFDYIKGRPLAPKGAEWEKALSYWKTLKTDEGAHFDSVVEIKAQDIIPTITWGTSPQDALPINGVVPDPENESDPIKKAGIVRALQYMGLTPNTPLVDITLDKVFIGSCTNSRIEDLRAAAAVVKGKHIASTIKHAMIVPGSGLVKRQAEKEGLDKVFEAAGFDWREAGCSMCLGMNPDILDPEERCASTSNRNFEGRQGALSRTHLCSPAMAAAAAIEGHFIDVRKYLISDSPQVSIESDKKLAESQMEEEKQPKTPARQPSPAAEQPTPNSIAESTSVAPVAPAAPAASGIPPFSVETGVAAPLCQENVDTDAIIPKQFLNTIKRTGLKAGLFYPLRFTKNEVTGQWEETNFVLNVEPYTKAKILVVAGENFGCGSSREHAPWALTDFGLRCIIAPSFGDIFYNNSFKNGLLPIRISKEVIIEKLLPVAERGEQLSIDLPNQQILSSSGEVIIPHFEIEEFRKYCLVNGFDDIGLTLQKEEYIKKYEQLRSIKFSFLEEDPVKVIKPVKGSKESPFGVNAQDW